MENYDIQGVLGKGSYGKIFLAKRKEDGLVCVLKVIGLEGLDEPERNDTLNEVCIHSSFPVYPAYNIHSPK
jgi:serine/threonine protein kinase